MFRKDSNRTVLRKGTSALQREESNTAMQRDQRHLFAGLKGQGTALLPFNRSLLRHRGLCLRSAVLSVLNERKSLISRSLHSSERKEGLDRKECYEN